MRGVLFLCVANSARSQIAEGLARTRLGPGVEVYSAGSAPTAVRNEVLQVLAEDGIDGRVLRSKHVLEIDPRAIEIVVTLCAEEECPLFLGAAKRLDWGMPDPAAVEGAGRLAAFRSVRDVLKRRIDDELVPWAQASKPL